MLDWCPAMREVCRYWQNTPMLLQTFEAVQQSLEQDNDTCIDCSKAMVESVCQLIISSFHTDESPLLPQKDNPSLSDWLYAAIRALKLGDIRDDKFQKLVSSHHKLAKALNDLRNDAGPASHGKDPYLKRLAEHHRRSAVLASDAVIAFLHQAYLDSKLNPEVSREPWERFADLNQLIDSFVEIRIDDDEPNLLIFRLPNGDDLSILAEPSRLLYLLDRSAYVEACNAAQDAALRDASKLDDHDDLKS
jgi:hypothetical protein